MPDELHSQVRALFHELFELDEKQRRRILDGRALDPEVRAQLEELLENSGQTDGFMDDAGGDVRRRLLQSVPAPDPERRVTRIGNFEITGELGRGGMGVVYEGHDPASGRVAAIKVGHSSLESEQIVRRFQREGRVLERFDHPGIAKFYEAGRGWVETDDGERTELWFLAMERVRGERLDVYSTEHDLGHSDRIALVELTCDALHHAHQLGIVHRDLKPQNILVEPGEGKHSPGQPKVLDFGIARDTSTHTVSASLTGPGDVMGTLRYMSPEQIVGGAKGLDARSDVYSLGLVLYELLTGRLPYDVDSQALPQIARIVVETDPRPLGVADPRYRGSPLEVILSKALEKNRARRFPDMAAFAADLRRYRQGRPVTARKPALHHRALRFSRRHQVLVSTMATLVLGVIASTVFAFKMYAAKERAERIAYRANLAAAVAALDRFDVGAAEAYLDVAPESLRGWEWRHLRRGLDESEFAVPIGPALQHSLAFSADGESLFALEKPTQARREWQLATIDLDRVTPPARRKLSSDGRYSLSGRQLLSNQPWVRAQRPEDGRLEAELRVQGGEWLIPGSSAASAPLVAVSEDGRVRVGENGTATVAKPDSDACPMVVGPGGEWIVIGQFSGKLQWWPLTGDAAPVNLESELKAATRTLAVNRDGSILAAGGENGELTLWSVQGGGPPVFLRRLIGHRSMVWEVAFSADGKRLVSVGDDRAVRLWDVERGVLLRVFKGHRGAIFSAAISPDGERICSRERTEVRVWRTGGAHAFGASRTSPVRSILGPRGVRLFTGEFAGLLSIYDAESMSLVAEWRPSWMQGPTPLRNFAVSERWLVVGANDGLGGIRVIDLSSREVVRSLPEGEEQGGIWRVAVSPDGARVAACGEGLGTRVWTTEDWQLAASIPGRGGRVFVEFSPDGELLATPGELGEVVLRRSSDLGELQRLAGHGPIISGLAFSRDGTRLAVPGREGTVRIWQVATGRELLVLETPGNKAHSATFSPDARVLASGGEDGSVHIWDLRDGSLTVSLHGHDQWVASLCFSPGGETLYSSSADGTIRLWETEASTTLASAADEYRAITDQVRPLVSRLLRTQGAQEVAEGLRAQQGWSERQREIASQLLLRETLAPEIR